MNVAKNISDLAAQLGTNRRLIQRCLKSIPALCPKNLDVAKWGKLLRDRCLGPFSAQRLYGGDSAAPAPSAPAIEAASGPTIADARLDVELERARKMRVQNDLTEGKQVVRSEVEILLGEFLTHAVVALNKFPQSIARFLVGIPEPSGIEKRLDYEMRPLLETLSTILTDKQRSIPDLLESAGIDTAREPRAVEVLTRVFQFIGDDALSRRENARITVAEMDRAVNTTDYSDPLEWAGPPPSFLRRQQAAKEAQQQTAAEIPKVKGRKRKPRPIPRDRPRRNGSRDSFAAAPPVPAQSARPLTRHRSHDR